jgi:hypothetical protein
MAFEPTIPVFEQAKTVHALDCAATVIGLNFPTLCIYLFHVILSVSSHFFLTGINNFASVTEMPCGFYQLEN